MERKTTVRPRTKEGATAVMEKPVDMTERVREAAYGLFEKRGRSHGNDWKDWFEAEKLVNKNIKGS